MTVRIPVTLPPEPPRLKFIGEKEDVLQIAWMRAFGASGYEVKVFSLTPRQHLTQTYVTSGLKMNTNLDPTVFYRIELRAFNDGGLSLPLEKVFGENAPKWQEWQNWSSCVSSPIENCGIGTRSRVRECSIFDGCENGTGIEFDKNCKAGNCEDFDRIDVNRTFSHFEIGRTKSGETCSDLEDCCIKGP